MMEQENIKKPVEQKVKTDTEKQFNQFAETRRRDRAKQMGKSRLEIQAAAKKSIKKEISLGRAIASKTETFGETTGSTSILFGLGLTLSLVNDFSDLATWQTITLISQTLDLVALLLLLFVIGFTSRAYFVPIVLFFLAFILEIMPVIGVVPWWTLAIIIWYGLSRKS
ncbi:MAG: hypothetical protein V1690_00065 [Candidatus Moraniibacteriota bacterium]